MSGTPLGGNLNNAVRVGDTVRRRTGAWTPAVHALLRYLETKNFPAPRVRGIDEQGREILQFISGETHAGTLEELPEWMLADDQLVAAAKHLRRYHDVVAGFEPPAGAIWRLVAPTPGEIICHNDWSPWNALFQKTRYALTLDWDLAGPGTRVWDIANAAYAWVPLTSNKERFTIEEQARRLRLFLDSYGLKDREDVIPTLRLRIQHVARFITEQAARGDPGMRRLVWWNAPAQMLEDDVYYLDEHRAALERAL
ncbi:MAG: phosphotransferase [Chloroflexota bacterium]|nr:phosphotransferase [Chloroflexota bacterium]